MEPNSPSVSSPRIDFLDNLRTVAILLVVLYHAGLVYESSGVAATFWIVDDPSTNDLSGILNLVLDILVMPLIFFVSGVFAPPSLRRRGPGSFVAAKARRLLLPWLVAAFTLIPLYKVIFLASRGLPQDHWTTYLPSTNGGFGLSWLWFLPVLFLFDLFYAGVAGRVRWLQRVPMVPALLGAVGLGLANSVAMDLLDLRGWTKLGWLDFQNERLIPYLLAFLLGSVAYHQRTFVEGERHVVVYRLASWMAWLPTTGYLIFLLFPWIKPGAVLVHTVGDRLILWTLFYWALLSLSYTAIEILRRSTSQSSAFWTALNRTSYSVYILHTIVLGAMAMALRPLGMPSLVKHLLLAVGTYAVCHGLAWGYRATIDAIRRNGTPRLAPQSAVEPGS